MASAEAAVAFLEYLTSNVIKDEVDLNSSPCFDTLAMVDLKDITASPGRVVCRFPVTERVQNRYNTLHGGCIATIVDVITSAALITVSERGGVSLTMSVDYLNPGRLGEDVEIDARVVKVGKTIAVMDCEIRRLDGVIVAQGKHTKFMAPGEKASLDIAAAEKSQRTGSKPLSKL